MPPADSRLPLRHAVALGLLQGPTELLPVSSSGHTTLVPWLAGWPYARLAGERRKSFEVTLHAGAALALAIDMRRSNAGTFAPGVLVLSLVPPALAGLAFRRRIEARLGSPGTIALGLAAGAAAMALADGRAGDGAQARSCTDAQARDGLALGLAQALALVPGVSRSGATLTAARALGFGRESAQALSFGVAAPVLLAAGALELTRLLRGTPAARSQPGGAVAAGGLFAFLSTLLSARLLRRPWLTRSSLLPYALYRALLATAVLVRLRRGDSR